MAERWAVWSGMLGAFLPDQHGEREVLGSREEADALAELANRLDAYTPRRVGRPGTYYVGTDDWRPVLVREEIVDV